MKTPVGTIITVHDGSCSCVYSSLPVGFVLTSISENCYIHGAALHAINTSIARCKQLSYAMEQWKFGRSLYEVPIQFDNGHNGNDEHQTTKVWATDARQAVRDATTNNEGIRWASLDGEVALVRSTPDIPSELLEAILSLMVPV